MNLEISCVHWKHHVQPIELISTNNLVNIISINESFQKQISHHNTIILTSSCKTSEILRNDIASRLINPVDSRISRVVLEVNGTPLYSCSTNFSNSFLMFCLRKGT